MTSAMSRGHRRLLPPNLSFALAFMPATPFRSCATDSIDSAPPSRTAHTDTHRCTQIHTDTHRSFTRTHAHTHTRTQGKERQVREQAFKVRAQAFKGHTVTYKEGCLYLHLRAPNICSVQPTQGRSTPVRGPRPRPPRYGVVPNKAALLLSLSLSLSPGPVTGTVENRRA